MWKTKSPVLFVVGRSIRNPVWLVRERMEMPIEILSLKPSPHGHTVTHDMEVVLAKVYNPLASRRGKVGIPNVPLQWNSPIKYLGSARHLLNFERNMLLKVAQCFANPFSGNTPANRKQHSHELVKGAAFFSRSQYTLDVFNFHSLQPTKPG
jgi:hypothetical protein